MLDEEEIPLADFNEEDTESDDETNNVKIQVYIEKILSFVLFNYSKKIFF